MSGNEDAKPGHVWVCMACGRLSEDRYGYKKIHKGWDSACMSNAQEFPQGQIVCDTEGRVVEVRDPAKNKVSI